VEGILATPKHSGVGNNHVGLYDTNCNNHRTINMNYLFIDESGELGSAAGSSDHFLITTLCIQNLKALEKRMWREKAKLYSSGWPKKIEIKGTSVWGSPYNKAIPTSISGRRQAIIEDIIKSICASPISIHFSITKKQHLAPHILAAEYGIAYNFLCGKLICRAYKEHFKGPLEITIDQRSKETHSKMKFDGYLETKLIGECEHSGGLTISHKESHDILGLQAVDFLSWGLFRHYEHKDSSSKSLIDQSVGYKDDWYSWKK